MAHRDLIVEQFTQQAVPFSTAPGIRDEEALARLVAFAGASPDDTVLDVACGPGLVVCAFAPAVRRAVGIDVTPAILDRARAVAAERGVANVEWRLGDVLPLAYPDGAFSLVVSRFAFHHFPDPLAVLREMRRVCAPRGRVVVCDLLASADPAKAAAFHRMEILRDPSHVRALTLAELVALFGDAGLARPAAAFCELRADVDGVLARSFPVPGSVDTIRAMFADSLADDGLGLSTRRDGERILFAYPVAMLRAPRGDLPTHA
jgi:SAM-dependent methyltransferase